MAIIVNNSFDQDITYSCFNNSIIRFTSNSSKTAKSCEIIGFGMPIILFPLPNSNTFWFNFKAHLRNQLVNNNLGEFRGEVSDENDPETFINNLQSYFFEDTIELKIIFTDETSESRNISLKSYIGVKNLFKDNETENEEFYAAHPDTIYLYSGYPLSINVITNGLDSYFKNSTDPHNINNSILLQGASTPNLKAYNITINDGRFDLKANSNTLFNTNNNVAYLETNTSSKLKLLNIIKITDACGHYFKFLNQKGGWSYFLFSKNYGLENKANDLGSFNNDFENFSENESPRIEIGKNSKYKMTVAATKTTKQERELLKDIIDSPKIYYYLNDRFEQAYDNHWIQVKLLSRTFPEAQPKLNKYDIVFEFEFPENYTQRL